MKSRWKGDVDAHESRYLVGGVVLVLVGIMVVAAMGVISFSEELCLSVIEFKCLGVGFGLVGGDIFDFGGVL